MCLIIGFALSFSIQFSDEYQFSNSWKALVKTMVMMMGEYEYSNVFGDQQDPSRLHVTSRLIFLMFIVLTSIVLMNLMVGVAVSDIQELRRQGKAKKLEKQADFLSELEQVITFKQLNSKFIPLFIKKILKAQSFITTTYTLRTTVEFQRASGIPRETIGK